MRERSRRRGLRPCKWCVSAGGRSSSSARATAGTLATVSFGPRPCNNRGRMAARDRPGGESGAQGHNKRHQAARLEAADAVFAKRWRGRASPASLLSPAIRRTARSVRRHSRKHHQFCSSLSSAQAECSLYATARSDMHAGRAGTSGSMGLPLDHPAIVMMRADRRDAEMRSQPAHRPACFGSCDRPADLFCNAANGGGKAAAARHESWLMHSACIVVGTDFKESSRSQSADRPSA